MPVRRAGQRNSTAIATVALLVILLVVIIFFALAGAQGNEDDAVQQGEEPTTRIETADVTAMPDSTPAASQQLQLQSPPPGERISGSITIKGFELYMLQYGAFSDKANTDALSAALKSKGLAGYVLEEGEKYKVMAQAFSSEEHARGAQTMLGEDESYVVLFRVDDVSMKVEAQQEQIAAIQSTWWSWKSALMNTMLLQDAIENGELGTDGCLSQISMIKEEIDKKVALMDEVVLLKTQQPLLSPMRDYMAALSLQLGELSEERSAEKNELCSKLRCLVISIAEDIREFSAQINNA